ncbi:MULTISPECIES: dynamin family protein [unclassified Endozoicomonas]|uniref:dynamin family protein n=1 Tax=unclassified Endozoicomonas TaxID=2644528 RepID=UPI003BB7EF91
MSKSSKTILVAATMSAGKSSLINALLGKDLLHSANEATTAKVARITIVKKGRAKATAYCCEGLPAEMSRLLSADQMKEWNRSDDVSSMDIRFPASSGLLSSKLSGYTFIDTPGANNSMDERHRATFIEAIKSYPDSTLLYVINVTQLGTTDDVEVLKTIREIHPTDQVIFALNKVDALDEELGETAERYVRNAEKYLSGLGFQNPVIIPVMALPALTAKKFVKNVEVGRSDRNMLFSELERFRDSALHLSNAAIMPHRIKRNQRRRLNNAFKGGFEEMSRKELKAFIDYTGLSTIEALVTQSA